MNIDALLLNNLKTLAYLNNNDCSLQDIGLDQRIPFGNIAFIKENHWKLGSKYINSKTKRSSHPGLSISSTANKVVFGSSQTDNRFGKNYFFVNPNECSILSKNMVFILNTYIPATISMIDNRKTSYEPLCEKKMKELKDAGYR